MIPAAGPPVPALATWRRSRLRLIFVAAVLATLMVAFVALPRFGGREELPPLPEITYGGVPLPLGAAQSVAVVLPNPQRKAVRVLDVEATVSSNAELVGVLVAVPPASGAYESSVGPGFPAHPAAWGMKFREVPTSFEPDMFPSREGRRHVEIVLGMRAVSGEFAALNGVTVNYELDGVRYTKYFPVAFVMCVAPTDCEAAPDTATLLRRLGVARPE